MFNTGFLSSSYSEPVVCSEPILVVTHKVGVCKVDPQGKDCYTTFTRLSFNGKTTVVQCESICTVKWGTCNIGRPYLKLWCVLS